MDGTNAGIPVVQVRLAAPQPGAQRQKWYRRLTFLFGGHAVDESVTTRIHFDACPDAVWNQMMFYEEVPGRPPWPLRLFLPAPTGTEGDKGVAGAIVRCAYQGGDLYKRITAVDAPRSVRFEVVRQHLGIEDCVVALGGSYRIDSRGDGCDVSLTTNYRACLCPRRLWRPVEKLLARQLHRHILDGMNAALSPGTPAAPPVHPPRPNAKIAPGGLACTPSQSHSRR